MKFTKAATPSSIPFGVYNINHKYLEGLKENVCESIDIDHDLYCGPVFSADCERGPFAFFVPIDPVYKTLTCFGSTFNNGIFAEIFDFKKMIPCTDNCFTSSHETDERIVKICNNLRDELEYNAYLPIKTQNPDID